MGVFLLSMTSRERVLAAVNLSIPDRVPMDLGGSTCSTITIEPYLTLKKMLGFEGEANIVTKIYQTVFVDRPVAEALNVDTCMVHARDPKLPPQESPDLFTSDWGITYQRTSKGDNFYWDIVKNPLKGATIEDLENYPWPDPFSPERTEGLKQEAKKLHEETDYAIIGNIGFSGIFEASWMLRGFEDFLVDLMVNKDFAHALLRKVTNIMIDRYKGFLDEVKDYLDLVFIGDDLATQAAPIMSVETYREMIKPYQKEYFEFVKSYSGKKLIYHSCGNIVPILNDLIEIGVNAINPVQVSADNMDPIYLKEKFGDRVCFWGSVDTQRVMSTGTPEEVRKEVLERIKVFGQNGGFVLAPVHNVQFDVPAENVLALYETGYKYGKYPLDV